MSFCMESILNDAFCKSVRGCESLVSASNVDIKSNKIITITKNCTGLELQNAYASSISL